MGLNFNYSYDQTLLDEEERMGLKIRSISTKNELDEYEQNNIEDAILWTFQKSFKKETIISDSFVKKVHKQMFGSVWSWAGSFRKTNKNIGVEKWQVAVELNKLLQNLAFWIENETFPPDEVAIRFKHLLVSIHCFPNGNGRHSRLMADIIISDIYELPVFSWGSGLLTNKSEIRKMYIAALRCAGNGDYDDLVTFARK